MTLAILAAEFIKANVMKVRSKKEIDAVLTEIFLEKEKINYLIRHGDEELTDEDKAAFMRLSDDEKQAKQDEFFKLVELAYEKYLGSELLVTKDPNYYYHVADLFCVPYILENGLKSGNDSNIWVYSDLISTQSVCQMCSRKKYLQTENGDLRWRNLFECGYGVLRIDRKIVKCETINDWEREDFLGLKLNHIQPNATEFLGAWNMRTRQLQDVDLLQYSEWVEKYLNWIDKTKISIEPKTLYDNMRLYREAKTALNRLKHFF